MNLKGMLNTEGIKKFIFECLFNGLFFATGMALFDYYQGLEFYLGGFLINFFGFGIIMGIYFSYTRFKKK